LILECFHLPVVLPDAYFKYFKLKYSCLNLALLIWSEYKYSYQQNCYLLSTCVAVLLICGVYNYIHCIFEIQFEERIDVLW
jgi:hypothetical protein